ncbi:WhiB family transcriptional regulator [Rhodococcus sp. HS-D2]|uniref:WhiB family transcriptional regulator n=1 Tax=Rhodococcus sp. HS-D2 TaxID=1384636 RepID=UPI0009EDF402|nr:WhiB family transcriptional regulator [Rhodococcus sp. HS-D2]
MTSRVARPPRIPAPITSLIDDRLIGARCAGKHPLFDAELDDETAEERSERLAWARAQCTRCPVQGACRIAAGEQDNPFGIWGGKVHGLPGRPKAGAA